MTAPGTNLPLVPPRSGEQPWIGVDPGAKLTGVILRLGVQCLGHRVIKVDPACTDLGGDPTYWDEIEAAINYYQGAAVKGGYGAPAIAIEGITKPKSFIGRSGNREFANPADLMSLAAAYAAIRSRFPHASVVAPGGNGSGVLASYPDQLITRGERSHKLGLNRKAGDSADICHARSAWDVSKVAERKARQAA